MSKAATLALLAFAALVAAALTVVLVRSSAFSDLAVYRWAGESAFEPWQLYERRDPEWGMQFLYPPFALLVVWLLAPIGGLSAVGMTALSLLALARVAWLVARAAPGLLAAWPTWARALLLVTLALCTEPAIETLRLGQVGLILLWLVLEDLLGEPRRGRGVLVGIATALKLTPAIYALIWVVTGAWRPALVAAATFAASIAIGWIFLPTESRFFWGGAGLDSSRTDGLEFVGNQSLNGVLLRLLDGDVPRIAWLASAVVVGLVALWIARNWWLSGAPEGRLVAIGVIGVASVLCSPISWTHHWVAVLPLLVGLWSVDRSRLVRGIVIAAWLLLCARIVWRVPHSSEVEYLHSTPQAIVAASYVLLGIVLLAVAAWARRTVRR